jgi:pimeloyl-ACP methyl ester carboxylesterase
MIEWQVRRRMRSGAVCLAVSLAVAGCAQPRTASSSADHPVSGQSALSVPPTPAGLGAFYGQKVSWSDCADGFQCGRLTVPVDYNAPTGSTITLALTRRPAGAGADRQGSLVINPGGPGGSGVEYAQAAEKVISKAALEGFDIVGFDPRGVGDSAPLKCLDREQTDAFVAADPTPDTAAERAAADRQFRDLAASCARGGGDLLAHVDTASAARDLDILRSALGDRRLFYLGKSYGTFLGATYAELFPRNVGRMVLDGAIDPSLSNEAVSLGQAQGFEQATTAFVADCAKQPSCPLGADPQAGMGRLQDFIAGLDRKPLKSTSDRLLTEGLGSLGIAVAMYDQSSWPVLRQALDAALGGDGSPLLGLSDAYTERAKDGSYTSNQNTVIYAVNCLDRPDKGGIAAAVKSEPRFRAAAPTWGAFLAWGEAACAYWPAMGVGKPHSIVAEGSPPIVVVGTTRDPATPYAWAQGLARQLSDGHLVTYEGDGHTAYMRGSRCIDQAIDRYLLTGTVPQPGLKCV